MPLWLDGNRSPNIELNAMLTKTLCSANSNVGNELAQLMENLPRIQVGFPSTPKEYWLIHYSDKANIQQFSQNYDFNWTDTFCVHEEKLHSITGAMSPTNYVCIYGIVVVEDPNVVMSGTSELLATKKPKIGNEYSLRIAVSQTQFCKVDVRAKNGVLVLPFD